MGKRGKTSPMEKKKLDLGVLDVLNNFNHFSKYKRKTNAPPSLLQGTDNTKHTPHPSYRHACTI